MAPPRLAPQLHSLPPMLYMPVQTTMPGYSKGSRGLSVPMRVSGIFTAATVSPSPSLRQRPNCYTIRAGRNLPDKEFRYLRHNCYVSQDVSISGIDGIRRSGSDISADLSMSPWSSDYILSGCFVRTIWILINFGLMVLFPTVTTTAFQHVVSEDPHVGFLLIVRTLEFSPCGIKGFSDIPAYSWI